jgi:type IV secretory pathway VirB2 component (pilin)
MSLVIAAGVCIALLSACAVSDPVETVLEFLVAIVFGVLAAIAAVFAAIFGIFGN